MFPDINPDEKKDSEPIIRRLVFDKNWNNKLLCFNFTVILPISDKYEIGEKLDIRIKERFLCYATISDIKTFKLSEITSLGYNRINSGLEQKEFLELMEQSYGKRSCWNGNDTNMQLIFLSKVEQLNISI